MKKQVLLVMQFIIGVLIVVTWAWVNYSVFSGQLQLAPPMDGVANRALGILDGALLLVLYWVFGSSARSQGKDDLIQTIVEDRNV